MRRPRVLLPTLVCGLAVLSACGSDGAGERVPPPPPTTMPQAGSAPASAFADLETCPSSGPPLGREDGLPDLELPCLGAGPSVQLAGLQGRPRLLNIWASWCSPCRDEMPFLQRAHASGAVDVLGVDAEDRPDTAAALLSDLAITFPSVSDPDNQLARDIRVIAKPTSLLVSAEGEVVHVQAGPFTSYDDLRQALKTYLQVDLP